MMKQTRTVLAIFVLTVVVSAGCQRPQVEYQINPWPLKTFKGHIIETEHYRIYTTVADPLLHRASAQLVERQYERISEMLGVEPIEKMPAYIFANRHQWEAFTRSKLGPRADAYLQIREGGYAADKMCVLYYIGRYPTLAVLAHELFHLYIDTATDHRIPAWLNEGLSTFFEAHEWQGINPKFTPNKNVFRRNVLADAFIRNAFFPLEELLATHAGKITKHPSAKVGTYYSQLWALIQFLRNGQSGKYAQRFETMLAEMGTRKMTMRARAYLAASGTAQTISFGQAVFRQYITEETAQFEQEFTSYIQQLVGLR